MNCDQRAIRFNCLGSSMVGIIDLPERTLPRGVLVVAGQPDTRLGAQRQFAMLARALARRGFAVMRFDRRGVGDSEGRDHNDSDIRAAVQEFCEQVPQLHEVVLLAPGSAAAIATASACARVDPRVRALLLLDARRGAGRRAAHLLTPATPAPAPIGAVLFWRRAQAPRRGARGGSRLAALAEQLCAFPGQVLVITGQDASEAPHANVHTDAHAEVQQLRALVARAAGRVSVIDCSRSASVLACEDEAATGEGATGEGDTGEGAAGEGDTGEGADGGGDIHHVAVEDGGKRYAVTPLAPSAPSAPFVPFVPGDTINTIAAMSVDAGDTIVRCAVLDEHAARVEPEGVRAAACASWLASW